MLSPRRIACCKADVPFVLAQALIVASRIFVRHQTNWHAELFGESARKFDRHAAELAVGSARHQNGIRGYQGGTKLALGGKPFSCVVLGVRSSIRCSTIKKCDECAQANSGEPGHFIHSPYRQQHVSPALSSDGPKRSRE